MSAGTPFMPFNGQPKITPPSDLTANGPVFIPNPGNALFHGSRQTISDTENTSLGLEINKPLLLAGLLGQRPNKTASQGTPPLKNLLQMATAATLSRPQTTSPRLVDSDGDISKQPRVLSNNRTNASDNSEIFMAPIPIKIPQRNPSATTSSLGFKFPTLPFQVDSTPAGRPLDLLNAHTSNDLHPKRHTAGTPVRQQPSPDPSNQSGSSDVMYPVDISGSFRTSTPLGHSHGHSTNKIRAQRVFQPDDGRDDHHGYYENGSLNRNRRHPRVRYPDEDEKDQSQPASKRQRSSLEPHSRGNSGHSAPPLDDDAPEESSLQQYHGRPDTDAATHSCILGQIINRNTDQLLRGQMEHFSNRVHIWENASDEDWNDGAEELKQKFSSMLNKMQVYMKRKQDLFKVLDNHITEHQEHLWDHEQVLTAMKQNLLNESQGILGGRFTG